MRKYAHCLLIILLFLPHCIKLDFFLFESEEATSIADDYHDLPLYMGTNPPNWVDSTQVEKEIYVTVPDGKVIPADNVSYYKNYIHGVFIPAPTNVSSDTCPLIGKSITFLYCHGNSGNIWRYWYRAVALWNMGANVFIFTYRGYGLSKGETSRKNIKKDVETAATYIKRRPEVVTSRLIVYGYSMGAIPASYLVGTSSHKNSFASVILESGLDSPEEIMQLSSGTEYPGGFFFDDEPFDGVKFIKNTTIPILHMHGQEDQRVIVDQAYNYYKVLSGKLNYTDYVGKTQKPDEKWVATTAHRNVPIYSYKGEKHIPDYWDDSDNPAHCCVHPDEYDDPLFAEFLQHVGKTTGAEMVAAAEKYEDLIVAWISTIIP